MKIRTKDSILLILFTVFLLAGISKSISADFIIRKQTLITTFKWCTIPTLLLAGFFAYRATFAYRDKMMPLWRNITGFAVLIFVVSMITFISFEGMLIRINHNCGKQTNYNLSGKVVRIECPRREIPLNKYSIYIARDRENDSVKLEVPSIQWNEGQLFQKDMKIGSLGFMYADK